MNKTKEVRYAEAIERLSPPKHESEVRIKSVKGVLYLEEYATIKTEFGSPNKKTIAQKGIGTIAIKGFKFIGSQN